jgi:hypothetical protein
MSGRRAVAAPPPLKAAALSADVKAARIVHAQNEIEVGAVILAQTFATHSLTVEKLEETANGDINVYVKANISRLTQMMSNRSLLASEHDLQVVKKTDGSQPPPSSTPNVMANACEPIDLEAVDRLKVADLKEECNKRGLDVSGKKKDLVERLKEHALNAQKIAIVKASIAQVCRVGKPKAHGNVYDARAGSDDDGPAR